MAWHDPEEHEVAHIDGDIKLAVEEELGEGLRTKTLRTDQGPFPLTAFSPASHDAALCMLPRELNGVHCEY